jgi:hypothetical protein
MSHGLIGSLLSPPPSLLEPVKRNVFVSYYHGDQSEVDDFIGQYCTLERIFTPYMLSARQRYGGNTIQSSNPNYVMQQIRSRHVSPTTVTMLLLGACTHSRRYIDWETKASLQQGGLGGERPNGVIAIGLPSVGGHCHLPERLSKNVDSGYAKTYIYPRSGNELRSWIEEAFQSRTNRQHLILNSQDKWSNSRTCEICGRTH